MTLSELATAINGELRRLNALWHSSLNVDGLVCRKEPGRKPLAVRMGNDMFNAVYHAECLLAYLQGLRFQTTTEREVFWESGEFWKQIHALNLEMLDYPRSKTA